MRLIDDLLQVGVYSYSFFSSPGLHIVIQNGNIELSSAMLKKLIIFLLFLLIIIYIASGYYFSSMLLEPQRTGYEAVQGRTIARTGFDYQDVYGRLGTHQDITVDGTDGATLKGWYYKQDSAQCAIVFAHGWEVIVPDHSSMLLYSKIVDATWYSTIIELTMKVLENMALVAY